MSKKNPIVNKFLFLFLVFVLIVIVSNNYKLIKADPLNLPESQHKLSIQGKVVDSEGNGIPGVKVTLSSPEAGRVGTQITSATGSFRFLNLLIGNYNIKSEIQGFQTIMKSVQLYPGQSGDIIITATVPDTGGIGVGPITKKPEKPQVSKPKQKEDITIKLDQSTKPEPPTTFITTIFENSGLNKIIQGIDQKDDSIFFVFYYANGKIYARKGISKIKDEESRKKLSKITKIPFNDDDYIQNGLEMEEACVYCLRLGEKNEAKLLLRVLDKDNDKLKIEYYIVVKK